MQCLDENTVAALFAGSLDEGSRQRAEEHVSQCDVCRRLVSEREHSSGGARPEEPQPIRPLERATSFGRYVVLDCLGQGGMGVVYSAYDPDLDRKVALKLVRPDTAMGPDAHQRLQREAQAMARLEHGNVVRVYDIGFSEGRLFVAMELLDGASLREWLHERRPLREVLSVFAAAGAALAAAHAAGLVHGDFKPDNVLLTRRGRVAVTDFGLAARLERRPPASPLGSLEHADTLPGIDAGSWSRVVGGTPAYMAPELWHGAHVSAASDQFAFCVAVYEALFGARPFEGATMSALAAQIARGERNVSPREKEVPARLRAAVLRGLATNPEARFASVEALLDELGRWSRRRRQRRVMAASAGALALVAVAGSLSWRHARAVCRGAETIASGAFTPADEAAIERSLRASGAPSPDATWRGVRERLHGYLARWASTRTAACEATRVRREQSEELLDLRLQCLDNKLLDARALVDVLAHADREVAGRAVQAVASLPSFDDCADARELRGMPQPAPGTEPTVAAVSRALASTRGLKSAGRYTDALGVVNGALAEARRIHYAPAEADALTERAELERTLEDPHAAKRDSIAALGAAQVAHADVTAAEAAEQLAESSGFDEQRFVEAAEWIRFAEALLERVPSERRMRLTVLGTKGELLSYQRRDAEALAVGQEAVALAERTRTPDDFELGVVYRPMVQMLINLRRLAEAQTYAERLREVNVRAFGPEHLVMSQVWEMLGHVAMLEERFDDALELHRKSLAVAEATGSGAERVAGRLNVATALTELGQLDGAAEAVRKAMADLEQTFGPGHPLSMGAWSNLALIAQRRHRFAEALDHDRRAEELVRRMLGDEHPDVAEVTVDEGRVLLDAGRAAEASRAFDRALQIYDKRLGAEHAQRIPALVGRGLAQLALGDAAAALPSLERAAALIDQYPGGPSADAEAQFALARALAQTGGDQARARRLATRARELYQTSGARGAAERSRVERWLAASPESPR
jgi:tetratricopeptide (TPR) repeat protein/predicted Ser/Thr protein kinase